jgi:hypothetical protein
MSPELGLAKISISETQRQSSCQISDAATGKRDAAAPLHCILNRDGNPIRNFFLMGLNPDAAKVLIP